MTLPHSTASRWYGQLAQHLEAGLPLPAALRATAASGGAAAAAAPAMAAELEPGGSVQDALATAAPWLPSTDRRLMAAAARSGRLPRLLRILAERHAQSHRRRLHAVLACLYPLLLLHLGLLLWPLGAMVDGEAGFTWESAAYFRTLGVALSVVWGVILLAVLVVRSSGPAWRRVASGVPVLRRATRAQELADVALLLGDLLPAGVRADEAWHEAGALLRSRDRRKAAAVVASAVAQGESAGAAVAATRSFPGDFISHYRQGEATAEWEQSLKPLAAHYQAETNRAFGWATLLYPGLLFLLVAGLLGYQILTFYQIYLRLLNDLGAG